MWLRISFFPDKPGLLAGVALDGNIYFRASDIGKFLNYSNLSSFAKRYGTRDFKNMVPADFLYRYHFGHSNWTFPVMNFDDAIRTIRKTLRNHIVPFGEKRIQHLQALWNFGTVSGLAFPKNLSISPRDAFPLQVREAGIGDTLFREWIKKFTDETLKMYQRFKRVAELKPRKEKVKFDSTNANGSGEQIPNTPSTSQVDCDYLSNPPSSVNNTASKVNLDDNSCLWSPQPSATNTLNLDHNYASPQSAVSHFSDREDDYTSPQSVEMSAIHDIDTDRSRRIFQMKYDGLINIFPDEIHLTVCDANYVFVKK